MHETVKRNKIQFFLAKDCRRLPKNENHPFDNSLKIRFLFVLGIHSYLICKQYIKSSSSASKDPMEKRDLSIPGRISHKPHHIMGDIYYLLIKWGLWIILSFFFFFGCIFESSILLFLFLFLAGRFLSRCWQQEAKSSSFIPLPSLNKQESPPSQPDLLYNLKIPTAQPTFANLQTNMLILFFFASKFEVWNATSVI